MFCFFFRNKFYFLLPLLLFMRIKLRVSNFRSKFFSQHPRTRIDAHTWLKSCSRESEARVRALICAYARQNCLDSILNFVWTNGEPEPNLRRRTCEACVAACLCYSSCSLCLVRKRIHIAAHSYDKTYWAPAPVPVERDKTLQNGGKIFPSESDENHVLFDAKKWRGKITLKS